MKQELSKALSAAFGNRGKRKAQLVRSLKQRQRYKNPVRGGRHRSRFGKHMGPGPHPSGTPQSVHGGNRRGSGGSGGGRTRRSSPARTQTPPGRTPELQPESRFQVVPSSTEMWKIRDTQTNLYANVQGRSLSFSDVTQAERIARAMNATPGYQRGEPFVAYSLDEERHFVIDVERSARASVLYNLPHPYPTFDAAVQKVQQLNAFNPNDVEAGDRVLFEYEGEQLTGTVHASHLYGHRTSSNAFIDVDPYQSHSGRLRVPRSDIIRPVGQTDMGFAPSDPTGDLYALDRLLQQKRAFVTEEITRRSEILRSTPPLVTVDIQERVGGRFLVENGEEVLRPWISNVAVRMPSGEVRTGQPDVGSVAETGDFRLVVRLADTGEKIPFDLKDVTFAGADSDNPQFGNTALQDYPEYRGVIRPIGLGSESASTRTGWYADRAALDDAIYRATQQMGEAGTGVGNRLIGSYAREFDEDTVRAYLANQKAIDGLLDRVDISSPALISEDPVLAERLSRGVFWSQRGLGSSQTFSRVDGHVAGMPIEASDALLREVSNAESGMVPYRNNTIQGWRNIMTGVTAEATTEQRALAGGLLAKYGESFEWGINQTIDGSYYDTSDYDQIPQAQQVLDSTQNFFRDSSTQLDQMDSRYPEGSSERLLVNQLSGFAYAASDTAYHQSQALEASYENLRVNAENERNSYDYGGGDYGGSSGRVGNEKYTPDEFGKQAFGGHYDLSGLDVELYSNGTNYQGTIMDSANNPVGRFDFSIDGTTANMDLLKLDPSVQGDGFASELLLNKAGPVFLDAGIERLNFTADITVGGYAWAKYPSRFLTGKPPGAAVGRLKAIASLADDIETIQLAGQASMLGEDVLPHSVEQVKASAIRELLSNQAGAQLQGLFGSGISTNDMIPALQHILTPKAVRQTSAIVDRIETGSSEVMPYEVAFLGVNSTAQIPGSAHNWHIGKMALIGTNWSGVARIDEIKHLFGSQQ